MVYEVLARKWRPQVFQDVIGQEHITQTLINAINTERLAHAYLFSGSRGVGKTSVARILAKAINCGQGSNGNPCNRCKSCIEITDGSSLEVQEIDGASNRGIDEIRELRENIKYMPSSGRFRVYIIDEVHMLTLPAFNALLKTLEEPPAHVKFLFATTEPHKVPVTILSRCQRFDFKRIPFVQLADHLEKVAGAEDINIDRSGICMIAREAEGGMRDAESLLDQIASCSGEKISDRDIIDILGIIDRDLVFETSQAVIDGSAGKCMEIVDRIYNYGYDIKEFYRGLMDQFRNLMICITAPEKGLLDMTDDDISNLKGQADQAGLERLHQTLSMLISREENLRFSSHPRLVLETILVKLCRLGGLLSFEELIKKIGDLEKRISSASFSVQSGSQPPVDPVGKISEPDNSWENKKQQDNKIDSEKVESPSSLKNWEGLLAFIASQNRTMANMLEEWQLVNFSESVLELARGTSFLSSAYLDDQERMDRFQGYCRRYFEKEIQVRIAAPVQKAVKTDDKTEIQNSPGPLPSDHPELPSYVQDVVSVFNGKVVGETPSKKK